MKVDFKYIETPEKWCTVLSDKRQCDICGNTETCFDAQAYSSGNRQFAGFCFSCVASGRLAEVKVRGVVADVGALEKQLKVKNPGSSGAEVKKRARAIASSFEACTPAILTWQDWFWPAHCSEPCRFLQLAGQQDFNALAPDKDGVRLFQESQYELEHGADLSNVWNSLKHNSVQGITATKDNWSPMAYIFRCGVCNKILSVWDAD